MTKASNFMKGRFYDLEKPKKQGQQRNKDKTRTSFKKELEFYRIRSQATSSSSIVTQQLAHSNKVLRECNSLRNR